MDEHLGRVMSIEEMVKELGAAGLEELALRAGSPQDLTEFEERWRHSVQRGFVHGIPTALLDPQLPGLRQETDDEFRARLRAMEAGDGNS